MHLLQGYEIYMVIKDPLLIKLFSRNLVAEIICKLIFLHIRIQELNTLTVNEYLLYTSDFRDVMQKDALITNPYLI